MYGPLSAYSSQDQAYFAQQAKDAIFRRQLIAALGNKDVRAALARTIRELDALEDK